MSSFPINSPFLIAKSPEEKKNPLLNWSKFPDFAAVKPDHVLQAAEILFPRIEKEFAKREASFTSTWEGTIELVQDLHDDLERAFGIPNHLNNVKNSKEFREAVEKIQPKLTEIRLRMKQSFPLYQALTTLANNKDSFVTLTPQQQRIISLEIKAMQLDGVGLAADSPEKLRFNQVKNQISLLGIKFLNNLLDASKDFAEVVNEKEALKGCSDRLLKLMAESALQRGFGSGDPEKGPWAITLDQPVLLPFLKFCENRSLREKVYRGHVTKASTGKWNNEPIINELLKLRKEEATILGFPHFAALSLSHKMAGTVESANKLIEDLFTASINAAHREFEELNLFAKDNLDLSLPLKPWDVTYVGEQYRKNLFKYSDDEISKYFTFDKVVNGLFGLAEEILGVQVQEVDQLKEGITTWCKDVKVYMIKDKNSGTPLAYFYGDFYSRPEEKNSGAWVDIVSTRSKDPLTQEIRLPVGYLNCNAPPPSLTSTPSILTFRDVETIFHEFGHCLQHSLTTVDFPQASGIKGIEWDFVEVASQFMENFCYEPERLARLSGHYETGEPMPVDMVKSLVLNRRFLAGMAMTRQLQLSQVDLTLHSNFIPPEPTTTNSQEKTIFDVDLEIAQRILVTPRIPEDKSLCGFQHLWGNMYDSGYSAGYYSYKWSEVYSADAYAAFEEAIDQKTPEEIPAIRAEIGRHYRDTLLSLGGAIPPKQVWKLFRGREESDIKPLLRHAGLLDSH